MRAAQPSRAANQALLEREDELRSIQGNVDRLVEGRTGATLVIEGPPGIGKSRLLAAAAEQAAARGATVLRARGGELEHELAFGVVRQLLSHEGRAWRERLGSSASPGPMTMALAVLDPTVAPPSRPGDPLFGLAALVTDLAHRGPVLLAVDDAQWLDDASARFLAYLSRRIGGEPVLIAATHRPGAGTPAEGVADLVAEAATLRPGPLTEAGVGRLLEEQFGEPPSPDLAAACLHSTGGIPLLVEEVARALPGMDDAARIAAVRHVAPAAIGRAVLERIERLPEPAPALAACVALFPSGATLADASAVADVDQETAAGAADRLIAAAVFAPGSRLTFLHPVMRAAVYEQLGVFRRRQGHARAARLLLRRGAPTEDVAAHLLVGEPAGLVAHVEVLEDAARQAEQVGALEAAVRYLARALDEPPPPARRLAIRRRLGRLLTAIRSPDAEATLRQAAVEAATVTDRIDVAIELAVASIAASRSDDAVETLLAVRTDAARLDAERALMVDGLLAAAAWESTRFADLYASIADGLPRDLAGTTPAQRLALTQVAARMFDRCDHHARIAEVIRKAVDIEPTDVIAAAADLATLVAFLTSCCAPDDAEALARRWQEQARETGREALYAASQDTFASLLWSRGDLVGTEAVVRLSLDRPGLPPADRAMLELYLAGILTVRGDFQEAHRLLDEAAPHASPLFSTLAVERRRGQLALAEGRPADAVQLMQRSWDEHERRGSVNPAESPWISDLVEALHAVGRLDEAVALMEPTLRNAERFAEPRTLGRALVAMARLRTGGAALELFERAVAMLAPSRYRWDEALARLELGAALRRMNRRADARPHLRHALDHAERQGLRPMAERAMVELQATGARPRRRVTSGVESLTPSERRIADLAASGMTNREIATHLFLTVKTVEMHLANAFGKLQVSSRRELPGALASATPAVGG